jgi:hypothetical protein
MSIVFLVCENNGFKRDGIHMNIKNTHILNIYEKYLKKDEITEIFRSR